MLRQLKQLPKQPKKKLRSLNKAPQPILERRNSMENNYYHLTHWSGQDIINLRQHIQTNDRVPRPRYYDIPEIDPDQYYMASIIYEDITDLTAIYIEEIIYPTKEVATNETTN